MARVEAVIASAVEWARRDRNIAAVALVGSHARGEARPDSDVDILILARDPAALWRDAAWHEAALARAGSPIASVRDAAYGVLRARHARLAHGIEVDLGVADPSWASVNPVNSGTRDVIAAGFRPLYDPDGPLQAIFAR